jgi:hypothetical protein
MLPVSIKVGSLWFLPLIFGLGTGLPVALIGFALSMGVGKLANILGGVRKTEPYFRAITALVFVCVGLYFTLQHVYHIL